MQTRAAHPFSPLATPDAQCNQFVQQLRQAAQRAFCRSVEIEELLFFQELGQEYQALVTTDSPTQSPPVAPSSISAFRIKTQPPRANSTPTHPSAAHLQAFFALVQRAIALTLAKYLTKHPRLQAIFPSLGGPATFMSQFKFNWRQRMQKAVSVFEATPQDWARMDEIIHALRVVEAQQQQFLLPILKYPAMKPNATAYRSPFLLHYAGLFFVTQTLTTAQDTLTQLTPLTLTLAYSVVLESLFKMNADLKWSPALFQALEATSTRPFWPPPWREPLFQWTDHTKPARLNRRQNGWCVSDNPTPHTL